MDKDTLYNFFEGNASFDEEMAVRQWMEESAENRQAFLKERKLFDAMLPLGNEKVIKAGKKRFTIDLSSLRTELIKIAAVIAVTLGGSYLFHQYALEKELMAMHTISVPAGQRINITLTDGTNVWLNARTSLTYPVKFGKKNRQVILDGEAYFDVAKDKNKPFIVHTQNSSVKVLGTEFNIDAYSYNDFVATTLVEGSVEFSYNNKFEQAQTMLLKPNEQALYDKKTYQAAKKETYVPKDIAWRNGQIVLKETPLSDILWTLSKRFNVEFVIKDPALYKQSYTGIFTNQQLERVLEHFKRASGIRYKIDHQLDKDGEIIKSRVELF